MASNVGIVEEEAVLRQRHHLSSKYVLIFRSSSQWFRITERCSLLWQEGNLDYDSEPERTFLRRRREARRRARKAALEQQLNMAAEHHDDNLNLENNQN
ncbi:hypothetical protein PIB30_091617 [Stylosanthes scabra]|uniref:Uncharacterized protein n=1 Tax=Stylosanthes scabra TaxID=79078 RepID=A0ABU6WWJ0_9FABA|nr:hypothetical protein [Stylosanthes scabra]